MRQHIRCGHIFVEAIMKNLRFLANRGIGEPDSPTSMPDSKKSRMELLAAKGVSRSKNVATLFLIENARKTPSHLSQPEHVPLQGKMKKFQKGTCIHGFLDWGK